MRPIALGDGTGVARCFGTSAPLQPSGRSCRAPAARARSPPSSRARAFVGELHSARTSSRAHHLVLVLDYDVGIPERHLHTRNTREEWTWSARMGRAKHGGVRHARRDVWRGRHARAVGRHGVDGKLCATKWIIRVSHLRDVAQRRRDAIVEGELRGTCSREIDFREKTLSPILRRRAPRRSRPPAGRAQRRANSVSILALALESITVLGDVRPRVQLIFRCLTASWEGGGLSLVDRDDSRSDSLVPVGAAAVAPPRPLERRCARTLCS